MKGNEDNVGVRHIRANQERDWRETKLDKDGLQKNKGREKAKTQSSMVRKTNETNDSEERKRERRGEGEEEFMSGQLEVVQ